jgi:predicted esterase
VLILTKKKESPNAKVIVACGSSGGDICWGLMKKYRNSIDGLLLLGSTQNSSIDFSANKKQIPIFLGHGSRDKSIPYK